jgi:hypothetical protein
VFCLFLIILFLLFFFEIERGNKNQNAVGIKPTSIKFNINVSCNASKTKRRINQYLDLREAERERREASTDRRRPFYREGQHTILYANISSTSLFFFEITIVMFYKQAQKSSSLVYY